MQAQLSAADPPSFAAYAPDSPYADGAGMTAMPNVEPASETVGLMQALQRYRASAAMIAADDRMQRSALKMLA